MKYLKNINNTVSIVNICIISNINMKKFFYSLILNVLAISSVSLLFDGFKLPTDSLYWWIVMIAFACSIMAHKPFLKFLTVKVNFLTYWLSAGLILFGVMIGLTVIMPDFFVTNSLVKGYDFGVINIKEFEMNRYVVMASVSFLSSLIVVILDSLSKGSSE